MPVENEDQPLAQDQIHEVQRWLNRLKKSIREENISYGELIELESVYNTVKE